MQATMLVSTRYLAFSEFGMAPLQPPYSITGCPWLPPTHPNVRRTRASDTPAVLMKGHGMINDEALRFPAII